jgi:hypothetical protein
MGPDFGYSFTPANQAGMLRRDAAHVVNVIARRKRGARNRRTGKNEVSLLWLRTRFARGCGFAQASHQLFPAWPPLVHLRTQKSVKVVRDSMS